MFSGIGVPELVIVLIIILLLFGAKKVPDMARALGRSSKEFKQGLSEGGPDEDSKPAAEAKPEPPAEGKTQ